MARTALTVIGTVVGAYFGYPQLGMVAGSLIGNAVDPTRIQGPRIGETGAQTSAEGAPRAIVYGTASVTGNVIQSGRLVKGEVSSGGGKGGAVQENEICIRTYAIRICEGPIAGVTRIWEDDKLVYDVRPGSLMLAESAKWFFGCGLYLGTETQMPDSFLMSQGGPEPTGAAPDTPAYRGTAYMVFVGRDLTDRRGSIPQYRFEVASSTTAVPLTTVIDDPLPFTHGMGGTLGPGATNNMTSNIPYPYAGPMMRMALTIGNAAGATFTTTAKFYIDGYLVVDEAYTANGVYYWQLNPGATGVISYDIVTKNNGLANAVHTVGLRAIKPYDVYLTTPYTGYNGGDPLPLVMLPTDTYYGVIQDASITFKAASWGPAFITSVGGAIALSAIVADIHTRCGIASSKYDVSELTDMVTGLVLAGDYAGADAIDTLRRCYFFDKAEYDKKLWYPKRGKAVAGTITINDLIEVPDLSRREQASEFPKKVHLQYQHAASGYAVVKATSARSSPDVRVVGEITIQVPVVLNEDQAKQTAEKTQKVAWAEAEGEVVLSVPDSLLKYVASDVVSLTLRGRTSRERIEKTEHADGAIKWTLRKDRQSAYTSAVTGVPIPLPTAPPPTIVGDTVLMVADISGRQDSEDTLNYLVAVSGTMPAWYGAAVQRSFDGGASFSTVTSISGAARMGTILTAVTTASEDYTDTTNVVRVQLYRTTQTIESITNAQFRSEGGAFLLEKADGTHEVMQYRDAVDEGGGIFALSVLNRGRLNSGASAHLVGAKFVMLEDMTSVPAQSAWIGQALTHRGVSFDQSPELAAEQTVTYAGRSQKEWPVASFTLSRSGNIVTTTWAPRHRFGSDDSPLASINFQGFRLTFVGTSTVTFDQTLPTSTYDVSAIGGGVTVSVASINRITGAGPATSGAI